MRDVPIVPLEILNIPRRTAVRISRGYQAAVSILFPTGNPPTILLLPRDPNIERGEWLVYTAEDTDVLAPREKVRGL